MNKRTDNVGEVGQLLKIANGVPVAGLNPVVRIHGLRLAINVDFLTALEEETVLLEINFLQPNRHHKAQQQLILLKQSSACIPVDPRLEFISDGIQFLIQRIVQSRLLDVLLDGLLEESNVGIQ